MSGYHIQMLTADNGLDPFYISFLTPFLIAVMMVNVLGNLTGHRQKFHSAVLVCY